MAVLLHVRQLGQMCTKVGSSAGSAFSAGSARTIAVQGTSKVSRQLSQVVRIVVVVISASGHRVATACDMHATWARTLSLTCPASVNEPATRVAALLDCGAGGQRMDSALRQRERSEARRRTKVSALSEVRLLIRSMRCRHCVRKVTSWLRDVAGVQTIAADATSGTVLLGGTMTVADVLAVFADSDYAPQVLDEGPTAAT